MANPVEALTAFSRRDPTPEDFAAFQEELRAEKNNRGIAILLAANAEIGLRMAIDRNLIVRENSQKDMFHTHGILSNFGSKIRISYAMGIYGNQHKNNLDCILAIRNAFAHAAMPITFDTLEVKAVCDLMTQPKAIPPSMINAKIEKNEFDLIGGETPRERYIKIRSRVAHNLFWIGTTISPGIMCDPTNPHVPMKARAGPLP